MIECKKVEAVHQEQAQEGATMIEYALLVALIAIIALAAVCYLGNYVSLHISS
jgi:Flp pilus assembly pilin Flp